MWAVQCLWTELYIMTPRRYSQAHHLATGNVLPFHYDRMWPKPTMWDFPYMSASQMTF